MAAICYNSPIWMKFEGRIINMDKSRCIQFDCCLLKYYKSCVSAEESNRWQKNLFEFTVENNKRGKIFV